MRNDSIPDDDLSLNVDLCDNAIRELVAPVNTDLADLVIDYLPPNAKIQFFLNHGISALRPKTRASVSTGASKMTTRLPSRSRKRRRATGATKQSDKG